MGSEMCIRDRKELLHKMMILNNKKMTVLYRIFGREIFWGLFDSFDNQQNGYFAQNVDSD